MKPHAENRLHIERLELDLRGIAPTTADAAARMLGPALARALAQLQGGAGAPAASVSAVAVDAGRLDAAAGATAPALATQMAGRIASRIHGGGGA